MFFSPLLIFDFGELTYALSPLYASSRLVLTLSSFNPVSPTNICRFFPDPAKSFAWWSGSPANSVPILRTVHFLRSSSRYRFSTKSITFLVFNMDTVPDRSCNLLAAAARLRTHQHHPLRSGFFSLNRIRPFSRN